MQYFKCIIDSLLAGKTFFPNFDIGMHWFYAIAYQYIRKDVLRLIVVKIPELNDAQLVEGILQGNSSLAEYLFFNKCSALFGYIVASVFSHKIDKDELINELYIYLSENDWARLRQFDFRSKLMTWISVVAIRFFQKKRAYLIENDSTEAQIKESGINQFDRIDAKIDIERALEWMPNQKYASLLRALDIEDKDPAILALEMQTTVSNVYNIRHRAHVQLQTVINEKLKRT